MVEHQQFRVVTTKGGWFKADTHERVPVGPLTRGWLVSNLREEGARDSTYGSWEDGQLILLREDGELMTADYHVPMERYDECAAPLSHPNLYEFVHISDHAMTALDRPPSQLHYRKVRSKLSNDREEMRAKYYLTAHAKGVGLSLALKRLSEA